MANGSLLCTFIFIVHFPLLRSLSFSSSIPFLFPFLSFINPPPPLFFDVIPPIIPSTAFANMPPHWPTSSSFPFAISAAFNSFNFVPKFLCFYLIVVFAAFASALLRPPIRITPRPPTQPDAPHHGPLALVEPADGFEFVGIGGERREQEQQQQQEETAPPPPIEHLKQHKRRGYRSCSFQYLTHSCNQTELCESRRLCVQITGDPCCAPSEGECPTPAQLGVTCLKNKPVNWCHHSQDCARSALCCDTGCGYNMCVERQQI